MSQYSKIIYDIGKRHPDKYDAEILAKIADQIDHKNRKLNSEWELLVERNRQINRISEQVKSFKFKMVLSSAEFHSKELFDLINEWQSFFKQAVNTFTDD